MKARRARSLIVTLLLLSALTITLANYATPPQLPKVQGAALVVTLSPTSGKFGDVIEVSGTGASVADGSACSITGSQANIVTGSNAIVITGTAFGEFTVGNGAAPPGSAPITVTVTCGVDSGTASFTVNPLVALTPSVGTQNLAFVTITGVGFASDAASCALSEVSGLLSAPVCNISGGSLTAGTGFGVAGIAPGTYNDIIVTPNTGLPGTGTFRKVTVGTADIKLDGGFVYQFSLTSRAGPNHAVPGYGTVGGISNRVQIVGAGFPATPARPCTLSNSGFAFAATSCNIDSAGTVTASFSVSLASAPAAYTVTVTDTTSASFASDSFTVDAFPTIALSHGSAPAGTVVTVTGVGNKFSFLDAGPCTLSSTPTGLITSPFCLIENTASPLIFRARFTISGAVPGTQTYNVIVTGSHGDPSAPSPGLNVEPKVTMVSPSPAQGSPPLGALPGTSVTISGTGFKAVDTSCTIAPAPGSLVISSLSCTVTGSTGVLSASFVVGAGSLFVLAGYTLTVTGTAGGDAAINTLPFAVVPRIVLSPNAGLAGTVVTLTGSGFASAAAPCNKITSTLASVTIKLDPAFTSPATPATCSLTATGTVSGVFTVTSPIPAGVYTVTVEGFAATDSASTAFTVGAVPSLASITVSPSQGNTGQFVSITGTGFNTIAISCSVSSTPGGAIPNVDFSGGACGVIGATGNIVASFTVLGGAPIGTYVIKVQSNMGEAAYATFTVGTPTATITLSPNVNSPLSSVSVSGSGFNLGDTTCSIAGPAVGGSPTCTISAGSVLGSFVVLGAAPQGLSFVMVTGSAAGDFAAAGFVVPIMVAVTSTTTSVSSSFTTTSLTTTTSTTQVSTSFSTTTLQTTGVKTESFTSFTKTTVSGLTATTTTSTTSFTSTTVVATTTILTTITTFITHTLGQIIRASSLESGIDGFGLLALFILFAPAVFRRLVK